MAMKDKQADNRRKHEYEMKYYDRVTCLMPKGTRDKVDLMAKKHGFKSRSRYVGWLIEQDMLKDRREGYEEQLGNVVIVEEK